MRNERKANKIYITVINRHWVPAKIDISEEYYEDFLRYISNEYVLFVQKVINTQMYRYKWRPLNEQYLRYKMLHGLSLNIWEATGFLKNNLKSYKYKDEIRIGYAVNLIHPKAGIKANRLARYLEYGTYRIPARPLFRTVYEYMRKHINRYVKKYKKKVGLK